MYIGEMKSDISVSSISVEVRRFETWIVRACKACEVYCRGEGKLGTTAGRSLPTITIGINTAL